MCGEVYFSSNYVFTYRLYFKQLDMWEIGYYYTHSRPVARNFKGGLTGMAANWTTWKRMCPFDGNKCIN